MRAELSLTAGEIFSIIYVPNEGGDGVNGKREYESYEITSRFYDAVNAHVDHGAWCDFIEAVFARYGKNGEKPSLVLDLGCGTGVITLELARRGYDMTGVDVSPEMLGVAKERALEMGVSDVLWLCQDMREFELYGTVDAAVSTCDGVNYLLTGKDLDAAFSLVHNYLAPEGLFVFDVSSRAKFRRLYRGDIVIEDEGVYCGWQNSYNEKTGYADFYLSYFIEEEDGRYRRCDEFQRQRGWSVRGLLGALRRNGFEPLLVTDSYSMEPLSRSETEEDRIYFVCRVRKTEKSGNNGITQ